MALDKNKIKRYYTNQNIGRFAVAMGDYKATNTAIRRQYG